MVYSLSSVRLWKFEIVSVLFLLALISSVCLYVGQENCSCEASVEQKTPQDNEHSFPNYAQTIVLFGDSITEMAFNEGGWGTLLNSYLSAQARTHERLFDIERRGFCGMLHLSFMVVLLIDCYLLKR
jgi:hypothetical protein